MPFVVMKSDVLMTDVRPMMHVSGHDMVSNIWLADGLLANGWLTAGVWLIIHISCLLMANVWWTARLSAR